MQSPSTPYDSRSTLQPETRAAWRRWLEAHHTSSPGVWLIYYRKHAAAAGQLTYEGALLEALCFGWIDSRIRPLDRDHSRQMFCPRKPKSSWSAPNRRRVARLIRAGLMTQAGWQVIRAAKKNGTWEAASAVDDLAVPPDLAQELLTNPAARARFDAFARSTRRVLLGWIRSAKRAETRERRIQQLVRRAATLNLKGTLALVAIIRKDTPDSSPPLR